MLKIPIFSLDVIAMRGIVAILASHGTSNKLHERLMKPAPVWLADGSSLRQRNKKIIFGIKVLDAITMACYYAGIPLGSDLLRVAAEGVSVDLVSAAL